jgi:hypothetical protein
MTFSTEDKTQIRVWIPKTQLARLDEMCQQAGRLSRPFVINALWDEFLQLVATRYRVPVPPK